VTDTRREPACSNLLIRSAKHAIDDQSSAKDWGREAIRLIVEDGHSVEGVISQTKQALAWHNLHGILDTDAKRSKFNNYFSTIRYLIPAWACGSIPVGKRDDVLRGDASFLSVYAQQKKLEKEDATSFNDAVKWLTCVQAFAQNASPATAFRLRQEVMVLLEMLNGKAPRES